MSGFCVVFRRDSGRADGSVLDGILERLAHRGPDAEGRCVSGGVGMAHRHFWTTPEEQGEQQPLSTGDDRLHLVFDGRLDNRAELLSSLGLDDPGGRRLSDGAIALRAYERWGEGCFERFLGPFAAAVYDAAHRRVMCARDALGDRTLFYHLDERVLVVASEPHAVLSYPCVSDRLDESALAQFFAVRMPEDGATFFAGVRELLPAHVMVVDRERMRTRRHWEADPVPRLRYRRDEDYGEHFLWLLTEAVRCRMRAASPPAVMMSGGLDSTSVAALAARELAQAGDGRRLRTISYVFDELQSCDERRFMAAMIDRYDLDAIQVPGDDGWPLHDIGTWPRNPNVPIENPYRRLKQRVYDAACRGGTRALLTGGFSDHLYSGGEEWLVDLLREGRLVEASRGLIHMVRHNGFPAMLSEPGMRRVAGRILDAVPGGRWLHPVADIGRAPWLTQHAFTLLPEPGTWPPSVRSARRPAQHRSALGAMAAFSSSAEIFHSARHGIELRHPYRDRRLVEFMLAVPAHQLYRPGRRALQSYGRYKHVLRTAMRGILPEAIRTRVRPTSLRPLYERGLFDREQRVVEALLWSRDAVWPRYVRPDWLAVPSPDRIPAFADGAEPLIRWQCVCIELWRNSLDSRQPVRNHASASSAGKRNAADG